MLELLFGSAGERCSIILEDSVELTYSSTLVFQQQKLFQPYNDTTKLFFKCSLGSIEIQIQTFALF